MSYRIRSFNLLRKKLSSIPELQIHFHGHGESIDCLTITSIMIWNDGSATIDKEAVIPADPLAVHIQDPYKIVQAEIIQAANSKNGFSESVSQDKRKVNLGFSFVDPGEGIVLRILHTGESSADLSVAGRIKDAGPVRCSLTDNSLSIERGRKISIRILISMLFLVTLGIASDRWLESIAKQKFGREKASSPSY